MYVIELVKNKMTMEKCVHQLAVPFKMMFKHTYMQAHACGGYACLYTYACICTAPQDRHQPSF